MIEKTLVLIKPDGIQRALSGEIIQRFEKAGLKIIGMKMQWINSNFAQQHYNAHVGKDFYPSLESFITSGPVIAMVLEGVKSVSIVRKLVGATAPEQSLPGTIRGDYAHMGYDYANKQGKTIPNLIHASGNKEDADVEVNLWFKSEELHSYKTSHESLIF